VGADWSAESGREVHRAKLWGRLRNVQARRGTVEARWGGGVEVHAAVLIGDAAEAGIDSGRDSSNVATARHPIDPDATALGARRGLFIGMKHRSTTLIQTSMVATNHEGTAIFDLFKKFETNLSIG
jgi:hypothetical protein